MQLSEVISALKENEKRYVRLGKSEATISRVRERIAIAEKWAKFPPSPVAFMTPKEREFIAEWEIENLFSALAG